MAINQRKAEEKKQEEIIERRAPPGDVVYKAIYAEGKHELERNNLELGLSGLSAGLSMGFSMVGEALLRAHLPAAHWAPLLSKFGYSLGFLIVILGRQQLFTKNTLTVILPLLREKKMAMVANVLRLWGIVLAANLIGAFIFASLIEISNAFSPEVRNAFLVMGQSSMNAGFADILVRGIVSGWLIALMVWLLPFAESARIWVIILLAYVIGLADLPHVVAGSAEVFYLVTAGAVGFWVAMGAYVCPALVGNVIGGVALVAVGAHAEFVEADEKLK